MRKNIHIIPSLNSGGAENMLLRLCKEDFENNIVLYFKKGVLFTQYKSSGIYFEKFSIFSIFYIIKNRALFNIILWLYKPCVLLGFLCFLKCNVYFSFRNVPDSNITNFRKFFVFPFLKFFSSRVKGLIFNSNKSMKFHGFYSIYSDNSVVIPNGFNFDPISDLKSISKHNGEFYNYIVSSRNSPEKNLDVIIKAFLKFSADKNNVRLHIIGQDTEKIIYNNEKIKCLGYVDDVDNYYSVSSFLILYSLTESFPNVLVEAVKNGCLCICNNVGDSHTILSSNSILLSSFDYMSLYKALEVSYKMSASNKIYKVCEEYDRVKNLYNMASVYQNLILFLKN